MSAITKSANGKDCTIRIPGPYPHDPATTVHCHYRKHGSGGMGIKPTDLLGARGCYDCHRIVDNRDLASWERLIDRDEVDTAFRRAIVETLIQLDREGLI